MVILLGLHCSGTIELSGIAVLVPFVASCRAAVMCLTSSPTLPTGITNEPSSTTEFNNDNRAFIGLDGVTPTPMRSGKHWSEAWRLWRYHRWL